MIHTLTIFWQATGVAILTHTLLVTARGLYSAFHCLWPYPKQFSRHAQGKSQRVEVMAKITKAMWRERMKVVRSMASDKNMKRSPEHYRRISRLGVKARLGRIENNSK